jgi:radical SAM protein with 4Fe4S-binding SPASM domain
MNPQTTEPFDFFVQMHLTERCNLACSHCYQEEGHPPGEMSLKEVHAAVSEIAGTIRTWSELYDIPFSPSFNITGGEPLLRNDLEDILRLTADDGFAIFLLTNGTLVEPKTAKMLARIPVKGVQVSLEGPEKVHDMIRGKHSFASAMKGANELLDAGITVNFNVTLSAVNAGYIPDIISIAASAGVQRVGFSRMVPYGRGLAMIGKMLKPEDVRSVYEQIFSYRVPGLEIVTGDPLASQMQAGDDVPETGDLPLGGCAAGVSGITVLQDGTLTPCRRLGMPIGNILKDSLRDVWANSVILNSLRDKGSYKGKCSRCTRWAGCRGCRAIAYAWSLSQGKSGYLEDDPQCFIESTHADGG